MRATLLSIGAELMEGFLTDTNATFLTQELSALGIDTVGVMQVGDTLAHIVRAFQRGLDDGELVIATGGIGPTEDDLTREAIAATVGEQPYVDDELAERVRAFFAMRGVPMPDQNIKQAWLIPSAEALDNPMGTAPGWFVRYQGKAIACMPGVPREMRRMWSEQVVPRVVPLLPETQIASRTLKTIGIGESAAEQELMDLVQRGDPIVATYAKDDGVHIRIRASAAQRELAEQAVDQTEREIRARLGRFVYGTLDVPLSSAILTPLARSGDRLAIWEAGTAARLENLLLDDPLADTVAAARSTTYADALWEVGTADEPLAVAQALATAVAAQAGVRYGVGVAARILPGETPDRAQGTIALALCHPGGIATREQTVSAVAPEIRRRATLSACDFCWSALRDATAARPD